MTVDTSVVPGLLLLALELMVLAAVGFVAARVALRQTNDSMALAQGLVIGPALWGLIVNFVMYLLPGLPGALAGWAVILVIGGGLAWRAPHALLLPRRTIAYFAASALAVFWVALASRQLLGDPDPIHLGLAASIRAGEWPPVIPWSPAYPVPYHYGVDMLIGLLTPPFGPDPAFTTELLGAYAWTGFVLVVATALLRRGGWLGALALTPLLLTAGAWTLFSFAQPSNILRVVLPAGIPEAGIRASLADLYWPAVGFPWTTAVEAAPANIWKPSFMLAYALAFVVLYRIAADRSRSWPAAVTLAALIGFLGLVDEMIALIVLTLWIVLEAVRFLQALRARPTNQLWEAALPAVVGSALAAFLLTFGGGVLTGVLTGAVGRELSVAWLEDPGSRRPIGSFGQLPGGVGLLGLNTLPVGLTAVLLARRNRLTLALAAGSGVFLLTALTLQYESSTDVVRLDGYARNFALLALLIALSSCLATLRPRWRYAAVGIIFTLITWPTAIAPVHNIAPALSRGPKFANAQLEQETFPVGFMERSVIERFRSEHVAAYIRDNTAIDARVLSPQPTTMTLATGRPNASGFVAFLHLSPTTGPEYADAIRYLEPAALRRLGIAYVHATDDWVTSLPDRARRWLQTRRLFEPLVRDGPDTLYRVRPEFLHLDAAPVPESFEALRQAVPASASVYLSVSARPLEALRVAAVLSHARVLGVAPTAYLHPLTRIPTEPLGAANPDLVVAPAMTLPDERAPIWWNDGVGVYAPRGTVAPLIAPPAPSQSRVTLSDAHVSGERVAFTATFTNRLAEQWTSQDWVVLDMDASLWELLRSLEADQGTPWFAGQIDPKPASTSFAYRFDARAGQLAVRGRDGIFTPAPSSAHELDPGVWMLAMRLDDSHRKAHLFPLLRITISANGEVRYEVFESVLNATPIQ